MNAFVEEDKTFDIETHDYNPETLGRHLSRLNQVRAERDEPVVQELLARLQAVVEDESQNVMPVTIELVQAGATMGDIVEALREVWGTYREAPVF